MFLIPAIPRIPIITRLRSVHLARRLPWELLVMIFDFVPPDGLSSIARVCKATRGSAERRLYAHIDLFDNPTRSAYFLRTVLARPELLLHVITYRVAAEYHEAPQKRPTRLWHRRQKRENVKPELARRSYRVCRLDVAMKLINAKTITHGWNRLPTQTTVDRRSVWPSLETFTLLDSWEIEYSPLLDAIPSVRRLDIYSRSKGTSIQGVDSITPRHVPLLEELICTAQAARRLVPNRPIWKLIIFIPWPPKGPVDDLIDEVAKSSGTIRTLGLVINDVESRGLPGIFRQIAASLKDVEELHLCMCWYNNSEDSEPLVIEILDALQEQLDSFESLRVLDFSGSRTYGVHDIGWFVAHRNPEPVVYTSVLQYWGQCRPTLLRVVFPYGSTWARQDSSSKWASLPGTPPARQFRVICDRTTLLKDPWPTQLTFRKDLKKGWPDSLLIAADTDLARVATTPRPSLNV